MANLLGGILAGLRLRASGVGSDADPYVPVVGMMPAFGAADVLGRLKTARQQNVYDADFEYGPQPLRWESLALGSATITHLPGDGGVRMRVTTAAGDATIRKSRHLALHVILHHGIAAAIVVLSAQPLEDPLGRVPLLGRRLPVSLQDRLDHPEQRAQLRLPRRLAPLIARRRRISAHLDNRLPAQSKHPGRLAPAAAIHQHKSTKRRVGIQHEHLPAAPIC